MCYNIIVMDANGTETYRIILNGTVVGGVILHIDTVTNNNELDTLFVLPEAHSKGIGYEACLPLRRCIRKQRLENLYSLF